MTELMEGRRTLGGAKGAVNALGGSMSTMMSTRVQICGVLFDDLDTFGVVREVSRGLAAGRGGWIATPNVDIVRQLDADPEMAALVRRATLVIIDGAPVQWAGRIAGHSQVQRAPGASLAEPLAAAARDLDVPMLLLGGRPGAADQAAAKLRTTLPGLRVTDHCPDYGFENDPEQWNAVREAVAPNAGGIVLCGFGYPKQERVCARLAEEFPDTWFLGIGGTIDFMAGYVSRAPEWVQDAGFEWAYRLAVEPKRLARRYLVDGLPFAAHMMVWAAKERRRSAGIRREERKVRLLQQPQQIDLDRRIVSLAPSTPDGRAVEMGFTEFLAAQAEPGPDDAPTSVSSPAA